MKVASIITVAVFAAVWPAAAPAASLVMTNARIYTVDAERSRAEALAINDEGVIIAVGDAGSVRAAAGEGATIVDLDGRMVLPGFQDAHVHAVEAGVNAALCLFEAFDTLDGYAKTLEDCADDGETGDWVLGAGVNMVNLLDLHDRPVTVLDRMFPDRPVLILDDIGHGAWANSWALKAAGYDSAPDAPDGNIILRDATGQPNGVVLENAPQNLRTLAFPPTTANLDFAYRGLLRAVRTLNRNGITTVSDAGGYWPQGHHKVWDRAEQEAMLTIRASNAFYIYPDRPITAQLAELATLYHDDPDRLVRFNQAKIYVDGILSQATGALLAPYEKDVGLTPDQARGYLYFPKDALMRAARELSAAGFQLHFHVTGDRGARMALDAIAEADPDAGPHRLTHVYLAHPDDHARFRALGAVADLQLAPSSLEPDYEAFMTRFIGSRAEMLMPAGDLIAAGATVTLSSDWDADELNPLVKIKAAVSRARNGLPDVATAIEAMTINPARLLRHSDRTGSIEPGKLADLVVLSADILDMPVSAIDTVEIVATMLEGQTVYDPGGLFAP